MVLVFSMSFLLCSTVSCLMTWPRSRRWPTRRWGRDWKPPSRTWRRSLTNSCLQSLSQWIKFRKFLTSGVIICTDRCLTLLLSHCLCEFCLSDTGCGSSPRYSRTPSTRSFQMQRRMSCSRFFPVYFLNYISVTLCSKVFQGSVHLNHIIYLIFSICYNRGTVSRWIAFFTNDF